MTEEQEKMLSTYRKCKEALSEWEQTVAKLDPDTAEEFFAVMTPYILQKAMTMKELAPKIREELGDDYK